MATLTFYGATAGVTGSCYLLKTSNATVLLDFGLFQGSYEEEQANSEPLPFDSADIDAVVLSHAHLDHSGRLPVLVAQGYKGAIYTTQTSRELIEVLLKDSAAIQEKDIEWENKRRQRAGKEEITPLYRLKEVMETLELCRGLNYHQRTQIADGIEVNFLDAGHILGSAIVELYIREGEQEKKLVFSGDLGNSQAALLKDPETVSEADILLLESTYGDRNHRSMEETLDEFEEIIKESSLYGGNVLIPSFAVGRTQEIIFRLGELYHQGKIGHQAIYLDSPMAIAVTEIYQRYQHLYNAQDREVIQSGSQQQSLHDYLPILRYSVTTEESMALNRISSGAIIIAGSGMCNGGRIRHHFKHNLWRRKAHVIFVGYQADGTPGRALVEGGKTFKVGGEEIAVKAQIHTLGGFSAHAGQSQLINWLKNFKEPKPQLYLVHGEANAKQVFRTELQQHGWPALIPTSGETVVF